MEIWVGGGDKGGGTRGREGGREQRGNSGELAQSTGLGLVGEY